jgi:phosphohistidine phosphatase
MKRLIIHRHAKSSWDHPELSDFDRPLNGRGLRDAVAMGQRLAARPIRIDLLVSSPAARAINTAQLAAAELSIPYEEIQQDRRIYFAAVPTLLSIVNGLNDKHTAVVIFGHNPGFSELAAYFTGQDLGDLPTAAQACITFPFESWMLASGGTGTLEWLDYPKLHN